MTEETKEPKLRGIKTTVAGKMHIEDTAESLLEQAKASVKGFDTDEIIKLQLALAILCGSVGMLIKRHYNNIDVGRMHAMRNVELYLRDWKVLKEEDEIE